MYTVVVRLSVHEDRLSEFLEGLHANAQASLNDEPGCLRFDIHHLVDTPTEFLLHEVYADADAFHIAHRESPHYVIWREVVDRCVVEGSQHNTYATPTFSDEFLNVSERRKDR